MTRLWDRGTALDATIERFTVGRDPELDQELVAFDALASYAHATMLAQIGVLDQAALPTLRCELAAIAEEARDGRFAIARSDEDGHTAIENRLTERLGEVGKRIHTGRSRNDQVIAALRLYGREALLAIAGELAGVVAKLLTLAEAHAETTFPGYTHTRQAMPSTLGQLFAAHAEGLLDAEPWLRAAFAHLDRSPLGSASGYGVALGLDRELVAQLLDFSGGVQENSIAVQNDRGKTEFLVLAAVCAPAVDLGRLASDLISYSSDELRFISLAAEVTTGSSIMPQKRNPDVLELVRATASRLRARQAEVGAIYASLPSGYQRDLQLTKEPFVESLSQARDLFAAMGAALDGIEVDVARCKEALLPVTGATDEVYRRVAAGEPFRVAYKAVASDPGAAVGQADLREAWRQRTHLGAPGALRVEPQRLRHAALSSWIEGQQRRLQAVWSTLETPTG
jgi:argininosuccinate lyase